MPDTRRYLVFLCPFSTLEVPYAADKSGSVLNATLDSEIEAALLKHRELDILLIRVVSLRILLNFCTDFPLTLIFFGALDWRYLERSPIEGRLFAIRFYLWLIEPHSVLPLLLPEG